MDIAQMDFFRMLRVGQSLPYAATHTVHEHARGLQQRAEILKQEYEAADAEFCYCKGLLAPIRVLPCELLMHIFMLVGDTSTSPDGARVAIGRVCRHWLSITTSFPALWSKIDIYYSPLVDLGRVANPKGLQRCLVLSHPRLLDVSLDVHGEEATATLDDFQFTLLEQFLDLLRGHVSRFRSLKFIGPGEGVDLVSLMLSEQTFQKLETLDLQYRGTKNDMQLPVLRTPVLNTVALNFSTPQYYPFPLITTYSGIFESDQHLYSFLRAVTNLKNLDIMHIDSVSQDAATAAATSLPSLGFPLKVVTSLQTISIRQCAITTVFQHFKFPNLERLVVPCILNDTHPVGCVGESETPEIIIHDLIQRSQCSLRALEIGHYVWATDCLPLFQLCSSTLTALHIDFYDDSEDDILPSVEMLTVPRVVDGVPQVEHLLPHLTDLTIVVCSTRSTGHMLFRLGETETMIRSRFGGVSSLKRLRLEGNAYPNRVTAVGLRASSLAIFLRNYQREGFDVTWIVAGDDMLKERLE